MPRAKRFRDVRSHKRLSLLDRMRVIKAHKVIPGRKLAEQFNCSYGQILGIQRHQETVIRKYNKYKISNLSVEKKTELLEKVINEWIQRAQCHVETGPITNEILLKKAQEALGVCCFTTAHLDLAWVLGFRGKFDISDVDMTMLRIPDNGTPLSLDLQDITNYVLEKNSILKAIEPISIPTSGPIDNKDTSDDNRTSAPIVLDDDDTSETSNTSRLSNPFDTSSEACLILNDEQAKQYLKPLEDYVLLKENYRAIGLITQLEAIFSGLSNE